MRTLVSSFVRRRVRRFLAFQVATVFLMIGPTCQAESTSRPDPEGVPTQVEVGIFILDFSAIDEIQQTLGTDFYLYLRWRDPRLVFESGSESSLRRLPLEDIWHPRVSVVNLRSFQKHFEEQVEVSQDGTVLYQQRFFAQLSLQLDYRDFPFDEHVFPITVMSFDYTADEVELKTVPGMQFGSDNMSLAGWKVGSVGADVKTAMEVFILESLPMSRLNVRIPVKREPGFYLWKIIFPIMLIVAMSSAGFWINPQHLSARVSVASLSFLILRVFWFNVQNLLPKAPYLSRMDYFMLGSTLLIFLVFVESIGVSGLIRRGQTTFCEKVDQWARRLFPFAVLFLILFALWL